MELTQKEEPYEPSLGEVYEKWQSQPNTVELWGEMNEEIRRAMGKELGNFGIPEKDNPTYYEKQTRVSKSPKKRAMVGENNSRCSCKNECICNQVKTVPNKQVIVISDDESDDEKHKRNHNLIKTVPVSRVIVISDDESDDENEKEKQEWVCERAREKRKQERALEKYGITFEQYYNLI